MRHEAWIAEVRRRWGVRLDDDAERLVEAVMDALREQLDGREARALAAALPAPTAAPLERAIEGKTHDAAGFAARVSALAAIPLPAAIEGTEVVLAVLAETLPEELLVRLRKRLHPSVAEWLAARESLPPPRERERHVQTDEAPRASSTTLASGRSGSTHPVSEARPDRAHVNSVARSDAPHADIKLSSARGMTQEREHESMADGHPPEPRRPLSG